MIASYNIWYIFSYQAEYVLCVDFFGQQPFFPVISAGCFSK